MNLQKSNNYRNRKLLDLAHRMDDCQVGIPGVCTGYSPGGCEPAHSNQMEDGHDALHAACCHACHVEIDQGKSLDRELKQFYLDRGIKRTLTEYFKRGWVVLA